MKRYAVIYFGVISFFFAIVESEAQPTDSRLNVLLAIDESQFINKPLDSIIALLPPGYTRIKIYSGGHQYTARCLNISYPNKVGIDLHVREFTNMNPLDTNRVWNISLMRKEKLFRTVIYKHNDCYRNCDVR
jgi:hypothetical protein